MPVIYEYVTWGELLGHRQRKPAVRGAGREVAQAIAEQVAQAIGRAEQFGRVTRFAVQDQPHLANRRLLDERLAGAGSESLTLLACDVDGLKEVNDREAIRRATRCSAVWRARSASPRRRFPSRWWREPAATSSVSCCRAHSWRRPSAARAASRHIAARAASGSVCWGAACSASTGHAAGDLTSRRRRGAAGGQGTRAWPAAAAAC